MKNIEILPLPDEAKKRIIEFAAQFRKMGRIYVEIVSFKDGRLIVRVEQKEAINGLILTKAELTERVRDMFAGEIPSDWKLTVSAVNFDRRDIAAVNAEWITDNMQRLGLKAKDIVNHTGLDKSEISLILSGERNLSKMGKAAFYYFLKYYEMSLFTPGASHKSPGCVNPNPKR